MNSGWNFIAKQVTNAQLVVIIGTLVAIYQLTTKMSQFTEYKVTGREYITVRRTVMQSRNNHWRKTSQIHSKPRYKLLFINFNSNQNLKNPVKRYKNKDI